MTTRHTEEGIAALAGSFVSEQPDEHDRTWQQVGVTSVLDGSWTPPQPTVGRRSDGRGLFYPGRSHVVVSETEGGKTWLALSACIDEMKAGNHVLYVDFEDDVGGIVGRLVTLDVPRDLIREQFQYLRPEGPLGTGIHRDDLLGLLIEHTPTLGILDGVTEAMTMHSLDPNNNADAATFNKMLPRVVTRQGAAVVALDHVTKSKETRGRYALGAVHKLNALNGAQYLLENRQPFGIGITGTSAIRIAKDRPAALRAHALPGKDGLHWYGDLVLDSHPEGFAEVSVDPPREVDETFKPTVLMGRVAELLARSGPLSQRRIIAAVQGRNETVAAALTHLIIDGYVSDKTPHDLLKPYPDGGLNT
jgi:hypothetical protein